MHYCSYHKLDEPDDHFRLKGDRLDSWCIEGRREYNRNYSRKKYAPQKAKVAARKLEEPTTRRCIDCDYDRPIEDFPERSDRPGHKHSRCHEHQRAIVQSRNQAYTLENRDELLAYRKDYQLKHPGYNRESSRRRRGRLQRVRHEKYTDAQVYARDKWICQLCLRPIDQTLKYPDPGSGVIDHIHPISKGGPDALNNVQQAHSRCNNAKHTSHKPFDKWRVKPIERSTAREIVKVNHYLHRSPNASFAFGLFDPLDRIVGVVTFGSPSSWRINQSICPGLPKSVIELNRLWISDDAPFGAASWFVSKALRELPALIVVSYADSSIQGRIGPHDGAVYRALSFNYAGKTKARKEWRMPDKARNTGKVPGAVLSDVSSKHRYWTVTGNRREKKTLRALVQW